MRIYLSQIFGEGVAETVVLLFVSVLRGPIGPDNLQRITHASRICDIKPPELASLAKICCKVAEYEHVRFL